MKVKEYVFPTASSRSEVYTIYPLGDVHIGALNCAEKQFKRVISQINADPNARWFGGGDICMPLFTEILTRSGWQKYTDVKPGDEIAGINSDGVMAWQKLEGVYFNPQAGTVKLKSQMFEATCTPDHKWLVQDGHRSRRGGIESNIARVKTSELKKGHRLVLAGAAAQDSDTSGLTVQEAALLGWIITDGNARTQVQKNGSAVVKASVAQSEHKYANEIRTKFKDWITGEYHTYNIGDRVEIRGHICTVNGVHNTFNLANIKVKALLAKINSTPTTLKHDMLRVVTIMGSEQREAMLDAMIKAEGWYEKRWRWAQKKGSAVISVFQILAIMCGYRISKGTEAASGVMTFSLIRRSKHATMADLTIQLQGTMPVWCPITAWGNWVFRQQDQIGVTGNCDAVILQDSKRFEPSVLPDWMLTGNPNDIRKKVGDMIEAQRDRALTMLMPIKDKCMGLIEGNHEHSIMKHHNRDLMANMCRRLNTDNLTDCCFIRLRFARFTHDANTSVINLRMFATHGHGGGRTAGAEPNHLSRLALDKDCEIVLRGHSHTQHILPPIARLSIPTNGRLLEEPTAWTMRVANWGCYLRTYAAGPGTYDSRATYPVRPLSTVRVVIKPFHVSTITTKNRRSVLDRPKITIEEMEM